MTKITYSAPVNVDMVRDDMALNKIMEMDHVIKVHSDGTVSDHVEGLYAPEVTVDVDDDGQFVGTQDAWTAWTPDVTFEGPWELLMGFSADGSARDPLMHQSQYIGGSVAEHILETPGFWVAVTVSQSDGEQSDTWALAYIEESTLENGGSPFPLPSPEFRQDR